MGQDCRRFRAATGRFEYDRDKNVAGVNANTINLLEGKTDTPTTTAGIAMGDGDADMRSSTVDWAESGTQCPGLDDVREEEENAMDKDTPIEGAVCCTGIPAVVWTEQHWREMDEAALMPLPNEEGEDENGKKKVKGVFTRAREGI